MNLLLLDAHELDPDGCATVRGRRARHLLEVLRVAPGSELRAGIVDGPVGRASVVAVAPEAVALRCVLDGGTPPLRDDTLLLAVPRPKVLGRVLEHAAALGFGRIVLLRSWRVDRSHLQSRVLRAEAVRAHLLAGLEQGRSTRLPRVLRFDRFKPFVEDELDGAVPVAQRFVAEGAAARSIAAVRLAPAAPFAVAIGPERGFTDYEVGMLEARGFTTVRLAAATLRVETAVAAAWAQLALLRELAGRSDRE